MRFVYLLLTLLICVFAYDFSTRLWVPLDEEQPEISERNLDLAKVDVGSPVLPQELKDWFTEKKVEPTKEARQEQPTAEELAARQQAELRKRMNAFGVSIGDYVVVLRGVSIGKVSLAALEVLSPDDEEITTELVTRSQKYKGLVLEQVEPLYVVISHAGEQVTVPLFKSK